MQRHHLVRFAVGFLAVFAGCSPAKMEETAKSVQASATQAASDAAQTVGDAAADAQKAASQAVDAAKDAASSAATSVAGAVESAALTKDFSEVIATITKALSGVTDAASAQPAVSQLKGSEATLKGLIEKFNALPPAVKSTVAEVVGKSIDGLRPLTEKILAIPGVGEVLKPHVDGIMSQLVSVAKP
jgi:hypothetical protein